MDIAHLDFGIWVAYNRFYSGEILFSAETFKLSGLSAAQLQRQTESVLQLAPTNLPLQKCKQVIRLERTLLYNGHDAKSPYKMDIKRYDVPSEKSTST
jgi:hypothetical protein